MIEKIFNSELYNKHSNQRDVFHLELGDSGDNVMILQEKLRVLGYFAGPVTGTFNKTTEVAVNDFQEAQNLPTTGMVDETTWDLLFSLTEPAFPEIGRSLSLPTLRKGSTGPYVIELQTQLAELLYFTDTINGDFGTTTESAVKMFQSVNKLTADGVVGRATWAALTYLYSPLAICGDEETPGGENPGGETPNDNIYIVQAGDTLYSIARKYGLTVDELMQLNNLNSANLQIGQELIIKPGGTTQPPSTDVYTVQAGDTLYSIARKFDTTVDEIKRINNLTGNSLSIGQQLIIPGSSTTTPPNNEYIEYIVVAGDNLYDLARRYDTTVAEIRRINNLTTDTLSIGQVLLFPKTEANNAYIEHIVAAGDNLYSIARKYNTTVEEIKRINNLSNNTLQIGQILLIPKTSSLDYISYQVKAGDTLYSIAAKYNTTVQAIKETNGLTNNTLQIGMTLMIPVY